jgi:hypothetical protein
MFADWSLLVSSNTKSNRKLIWTRSVSYERARFILYFCVFFGLFAIPFTPTPFFNFIAALFCFKGQAHVLPPSTVPQAVSPFPIISFKWIDYQVQLPL